MSIGNLKRIHVNGRQIRENKGRDETKPVIVAKAHEDGEKVNEYGRIVDILGKEGQVVAQVGMNEEFGRSPLSCGASAWVETRRPIRVRDQEKEKSLLIGRLNGDPKNLYE